MFKARSSLVIVAVLGIVAGGVAGVSIAGFLQIRPVQTPSPEEIAKPHLSWADQECERIIEEHVKAIDTFFADSKKNTRGFAEEALSWGSKWRLVVDYIPFTSGGRHETFIRERFEEHVFKSKQLEEALKQVVSRYLKHAESIEGQMLVRIRADVADFPTAYLIAQINESKLRQTYDEAITNAIEATGAGLQTDLATEVVSTITTGLLRQIAIRLGLSTGVLGTGAAASWGTLGVSILVSLIVDYAVSWVWDWYADPKGNLAAELDRKLDEINRLMVDGSDDVQGLRTRLHDFAKERATLRRQAVLTLLQPQ
jgi:hypothetical protein